MKNGQAMQEEESYSLFRHIVPRNPFDWEGTVVLYSARNNTMFNIAFGSGGNLDDADRDEGFDDYIMVEQYEVTDEVPLYDIMMEAKRQGYVDDGTEGLHEIDGGEWVLKHKDWKDGDIRRFLMEAMDFAGYGHPSREEKEKGVAAFEDVVFVACDYKPKGMKETR